ncbi:hypothetical protein HXX76_008943 [Chlamydomonas incerta]|uniref:BACK domain-containing protein n=1 Tax=Chlamydomonas incerta TaxID=51695 RepID=A0A835SYX1_CHLIN|nr:hypothetical protein HXX76_008943 [Chlamydomonas incerta]|eukprot:KAG2432603.1 hypothetical protein HXX76_008943 [Chlamydomonas incerta]
MAPGNPDVIDYLAGLYGQQEYSDCKVVFMLEKSPPGGQVAPVMSALSLAPGSVVGQPLPAHSCILRPACDKWNQQWLDWTPRPDIDARASKRRKLSAEQAVAVTITVAGEARPSAAARADVPEICIAVRSADEVAAAAAVVKFAYTGLVEVGSITEALQVRQQADYLRMPRCMEACLALVNEKLLGAGPSAGTSSSSIAGGGGGSGNSSRAEGATELFRCSALWPDPANDPTFAAFEALLAEAKRRLVAHFGDALAVLNDEDLLDQMGALPAVGLETLLASDDFGTDDESSVVLVLAKWMEKNYSSTDADTRRRLCELLRLVQCSRAYLDWVLPALALDHHCHPDSRSGWLPIAPAQAGWLSKYVGASGAIKTALWEGRMTGVGVPEGWRNNRPRRQCVPPAGLTCTYSASKEDLLEEYSKLLKFNFMFLKMDARPKGRIWAMGLEWCPALLYNQDTARATMSFHPLEADVYLYKWGASGRRMDVLVGNLASDQMVGFGSWTSVGGFFVPGAAAQPAPLAKTSKKQEEQARRAREAAVAAQWAAYMKYGKLTGKVVLLPLKGNNQQ